MKLNSILLRLRKTFSRSQRSTVRRRSSILIVERLEDRRLFAVSILNNAGNGYSALSFNTSGGYVPPDTTGAAGPSAYVETVNQSLAIYPVKGTGANPITDSLSHFLFTTGGLSRSGSGLSDPIVAYDEKIERFIVGDQDVNFSTHVSAFDLAVSRTNDPKSLTATDWVFYKITTTQVGEDADYPGNFGYNADAFVFTLNMFAVAGSSGTNHVQVVSVNAADLAGAIPTPHVFSNNLADFSVRPTTMHDAVAGDPMWLVTDHGNGLSIDVYKMTNVLTSTAAFQGTNLAVASYSQAVAPKNPNGTSITTNIDSRIMKAAEANKTIVAAHTVAISSTQDVAQWYAIDVSGSTPVLAQQGRINAGNNTYVTYPGIDINAAGSIGMSYIQSGNDTTTDYMSMWVTGRLSSDAASTMETPVRVPSGTGLANYTDFASTHRQGDLSGINVDPVDGSFWAVNEFANTQATANWGTAVANFRPSLPANSADLAVTMTGPSSITAGTNATYTLTMTNNGPFAATGVVLTNTLPAGSTFSSMTQTIGTDLFVLGITGSTATETASASIASGSTDTFVLIVSAATSLLAGVDFSNSASVSSTTVDSNILNNSVVVTGSIIGPEADLSVTNTGPATANEGDQITFTVTVTNLSTTTSATGVVLKNTLGANLSYQSATTTLGTFTQSGSIVTFSLGSPLSPGVTVTLTVTARSTEDGTLANTAVVTATSADLVALNNSSTASTVVAEPPIVVVFNPNIPTLKRLSNFAVATFTHASGVEPTSAFVATINWGDGTPTSAGTITLSGTTYSVIGSHRYSSSGTRTVTTTVVEMGAAAELLLSKVGDEVPDLPIRYLDHENHGRPTINNETNEFVRLVGLYVSQAARATGNNANNGGVTRDLLVAKLASLQARGLSEGKPHLNGLMWKLSSKFSTIAESLDVLLLIRDLAD